MTKYIVATSETHNEGLIYQDNKKVFEGDLDEIDIIVKMMILGVNDTIEFTELKYQY